MKPVTAWPMPILAALALAGCSGDQGPPLSASGVEIIAPLPGRTASVAYMTLTNHGDRAVVVHDVSSPAFREVQMHETVVEADIARMSALPSLTIEAGSSVTFEPGGKHLMLLDPRRGLTPGQDVVLELRYDDGGILLLTSRLATRAAPSN